MLAGGHRGGRVRRARFCNTVRVRISPEVRDMEGIEQLVGLEQCAACFLIKGLSPAVRQVAVPVRAVRVI